MSFQKITVIVAIVILLIILLFIGYSLSKFRNNSASSITISDCPDYYSKDPDNPKMCKVNSDNVYPGLSPGCRTFDYSTTTTDCQKLTLMNTCNIQWDGIGHNNDIRKKCAT